MACPAASSADVLNCRFSPVNYELARRFSSVVRTLALCFSIFLPFASKPVSAQARRFEESVEHLARRTAPLLHERRMSLLWINHAGLSEQRAEYLRSLFLTHLESAQVRFVHGEAAPALRVSIEQTPSQIVFTVSVPAEDGASVVIEEVPRSLAGSDERPANTVQLEKELIWQQEARILSAALRVDSSAAEKRLILLTEDTLLIYGDEQGNWKLQSTKPLPGPRSPQRASRGQLVTAEDNLAQVGIWLPDRRCEASLADDSQLTCTRAGPDLPTGRLLALPACGAQTWWLKSDTTDWVSEDRLLLRSSGAASDAAPAAELNFPGPVFSIAAGPNAGSAAVVVRNLSSGNYEVYRVALACAN
jgi:hypothetical protein